MPHAILPKDITGIERQDGEGSLDVSDHMYFVGDVGYIYTGPGITDVECAPLTATIYLSVCRTHYRVRTSSGTRTHAATAMKSEPRSISSCGAKLAVVHVNPVHSSYRTLQRTAIELVQLDRGAFARLDAALQAAYGGDLSASEAASLFEDVVQTTVAQLSHSCAPDERAQRWLERLSADENCSLRSIAHEFGLSYAGMSRAFSVALGISLRDCRLWLKLDSVVRRFCCRNMSLTDLAHEAGFCDLAHMTRMFQRVYGAPPSYFLRNPRVKRFDCLQSGAPPRQASC